MPPIAKPLAGFGSGVFELALALRGDAFRVVFAVQLGADLRVIHAFQKKFGDRPKEIEDRDQDAEARN